LKIDSGDEEEFADFVLLHAVRTYDTDAGTKFTTWLYKVMEQQSINLYKKFKHHEFETGGGEISLAEPVPMSGGEEVELEQFLKEVENLRLKDDIAYKLLRQKVKEKLEALSPRLFEVFKLMFEQELTNPQVAKALRISPSRVTGLKKQIVEVLRSLLEIKEMETDSEVSTSSLR